MFSIKNLFLWQKFALLAVLAVVMISVPLGLLISKTNETVATAAKEKLGVEYARATIKLIQLIQQHRELSSIVLSGGKSSVNKWEAKRNQINQQTKLIDNVDGKLTTLGLSTPWGSVRKTWDKLAISVAGLTLSESMARHTELIEELFRFNRRLADESELSLDPEMDTYYLMLSSINRVPQLSETLGKLRTYGNAALLQKNLSQENRILSRTVADDATKLLALIEENLAKVALKAWLIMMKSKLSFLTI